MTYRSVLVFVDAHPLCAARTQVAIRLAKLLECHLVGVAPTGLVDLSVLPEAFPSIGDFGAKASNALRSRAEHATERFRQECRTAGLKSFDAVIEESDQARSLVRYAHCSDLTVLTQADPAAPGSRRAQALVEQVVIYSGRATLIIPYAGPFDTGGQQRPGRVGRQPRSRACAVLLAPFSSFPDLYQALPRANA